LEYQEGKLIPGTNFAGFLVVRPTKFLDRFPVGELASYWHNLIPVDRTHLESAKRTNVYTVAAMLEGGDFGAQPGTIAAN
jgi:hypothetical protein